MAMASCSKNHQSSPSSSPKIDEIYSLKTIKHPWFTFKFNNFFGFNKS
jgi:hypothetical protein